MPDINDRDCIQSTPATPLHAYKDGRLDQIEPDSFEPRAGRAGAGEPHPPRPRYGRATVSGPDAAPPQAGRSLPPLPNDATGDNPPRWTYDGTVGAGSQRS